MADTTISSSDPRKLYDRSEPPPVTSGGPPPKKASDASAQPNDNGPTAYDVKDVAKYMPATPLTGSSSGPKEETLDALKGQKAALDKKLALPADYPTRKLDEARRDDLARRILDKESQAKAIARDTECPAWAACQPTMRGSDPNAGGWTITPSTYAPEQPKPVQGTAFGTKDDRVRVGYVDATTATDSANGRQRVDQVAVGVLKAQNQTTGSDGVTRSTTVVAGTAFAQTGPTNPDGSKGIGVDVGATAVGVERNYEAPDGTALTLGVSLGAAVGGSLGIKDAKNGGSAVCGRAELGPVTVGGCAPIKQGTAGGDT